MIPTDNGNTQPCSPISSNCVVWQGPDIACINLCNGDSVSDVVAALATKLCELIDQTCECDPDISSVDLKCALPSVPPTDLSGTLQAIIDYLCEVATKDILIPNLPLPNCLQYRDGLGNTVVELGLIDWATLIGNSICTLIESIGIIDSNYQNILSRIQILEDCVLPCNPSSGNISPVVSSCILRGQEVTVQTLLLAIETEFCALSDAVGSVSLINNAINQGNCLNATTTSLNGVSSLGDLGWVTAQTLAESTQNQWVAICDLYQAVSDIQNNCCDDGCDTVAVLYSYSIISGGGFPVGLNIPFTASTIPSGYTDCGSIVTVTDSSGSSVNQNINIANLSQPGTTPFYIDVSTLNTLDSLIIQVESCLSNGTTTCGSSTSQVVPLTIPCPSSVNVIPGTTNINVSFSNTLGGAVSYTIQVFETNNPSAVLGVTTIANPGTLISENFVGAAEGTEYTVQVSVTSGTSTVTCSPISVITLGQTCNTIEVTTSSSVLTPSGIWLGKAGDFTASNGIYYFYNFTTGVIELQTGLDTSICAAPILSALSVGALGLVSLTAAWGNGAETAIKIYSSSDGVNYGPVDTGVDGARSIATSITSGSIYIKAITECSAGDSIEFITRYDYGTGGWTTIQSPSECIASPLDGDECPAGVQVSQQFLDCEGTNIAVPGAPLSSYWFYIGKRIDTSGINPVTRYVYGGWIVGGGLRKVVECCACPAFILSDTIRVFAGQEAGYTTNIEIPYVMGDGSPVISLYGAGPLSGTLNQVDPGGNVFTYITDLKIPNHYGDTFQISIDTQVGGVCSTAIATIQIQIIPYHTGLRQTDEDIYVFVHADPTSYTEAEALEMKNGFTILQTYWNTEFGYTGDIYWMPVDESNYLAYTKAVQDDGASVTLTSTGTWATQRNLPTSWTGGAGVNKRRALIIALTNDASATYHGVLGNDFAGQPTNTFKDDYEAWNDMYNGTAVSLWAQNFNVNGITQPLYPDGLSIVLFPLTQDGSSSADSACLLQMLGATTGEIIPAQKYGIPTLTDTSTALSINPYFGAVTNDGTSIKPLYDFENVGNATGRGLFSLLSQIKSNEEIAGFADAVNQNERWRSLLTTAIKGATNSYPAGTLPTDDTYRVKACPAALSGGESEYYVKITNYGYGAITEGTVLTLQNDGASFPAGAKDAWGTGVQALCTILENDSAVAYEIDPASVISIGGSCI
ncbi:hypothetical protein N9926_00955 [Flavobacteriaceae bacterium]|nr:hypothetical protein [Flavobacteriaceae bacterium]